jgi:hypothetical protein
MSEYTVHLIGVDDDETAHISTQTQDRDCCITFTFRGRSIEASASDYFEAFCKIRLILESDKIIPFCYGSSLNVYPSGMCRDMGSGLSAYKLAKGKKPERTDLVKIFDEGFDVIPAYVNAQKEYFADWLKSIQA